LKEIFEKTHVVEFDAKGLFQMFKSITKILGGDPIQRQLESYRDNVQAINHLEPEIQSMSDDELKAKTKEFRSRLAAGETLEDILVEAYAVVREVSVRTVGLRQFDVQLIGGIIIHEGTIAEMRTGEGKTLVATMPIYLNAIEGNGVHLVTVNDYLARRDARWMGPVFEFLGLSVGILQEASRTESGRKAFIYDPSQESVQEDIHMLKLVDRKLAYAADVTYGTNNEFGFDYLRDNMARRLEDRSQRGHNFAILDEVDNILIDEARTPLIISGPSHENPELYEQMAVVVRQLSPEDFEVSERDRTVAMTEIGENHVERILNTPLRDPDRPEDITPEQARMLGHLEQAMRAEFLFKRNKDYVVQGGRVIIVDDFTGRLMAGRRWSDGLHQAVEAKEGVKVRQENVTYATITLQNYFRMYNKLSGMTGTAVTEAEEFNKIYQVDVIPLPTNLGYVASQPETDLIEVEYKENGNKFQSFIRKGDPDSQPIFWRRKDYPDVVFRTEEAKLRAVTTEILKRHVRGQPLLVGTTSVELSEKLSNRLKTELLRRLTSVLVLRDVYFERNDVPDDGMRVESLEELYHPINKLNQSALRQFAREFDVSINPTKPENLERLRVILDLDVDHLPKLEKVLDSGIPHNVLNAKKHDEESRIIADAGALGAVTIATNMAGRGVDIKLGGEIAEEVLAANNRVLRRAGIKEPENLNMEERLNSQESIDKEAIGIYDAEVELFKKFMDDGKKVKQVGGLHVIGSERHDARRIDNQLRGRAARQGDAGSSQFFLSLEDELMRLFGGSQVSNLMQRFNIDDAVPIAHNIVNRTIEQAQTRVEGANFDTRKHLLEYDDVLNQQREVFYNQRNRVFEKNELNKDIDEMLQVEVSRHIDIARDDPDGLWKLLAWLEETQPTIDLQGDNPYPSFMLRLLVDTFAESTNAREIRDALLRIAGEALEAHYQYLAKAVDEQLERALSRLEDQVQQRLELAEMAVEGAELEEGGPDTRQLIQDIERIVGLRIQIDDKGDLDLDRLRDMLPNLIETSLGLRVWAALIQAVESRIGEKLPLEPSLPLPIDWDEAEESLLQAFQETWDARVEVMLKDIARDLDNSMQDREISQVDILRFLIQMSFGQRTLFDRKTHQRRAISIARFSYAFSAARLIESLDETELVERITRHLTGAKGAIEGLLGKSEINRLAATKVGDLDEKLEVGLKTIMGTEFSNIDPSDEMHELSPSSQENLGNAIGQLILTEAHRRLLLSVGDRLWVDYLTQIEALRTSIGLEAYGQRDPLVQYKSRAFDMFQQLLIDVRAGVVSQLFRIQAAPKSPSTSRPPVQARIKKKPAGTKSTKKKRKRRRKRR
jgi:preprotein translocase subunit SecA